MATIARSVSRSPVMSPSGAGLHEHVADRRRLDRPGQHGEPARSAVSWHSSAFCDPPPTRWMTVTGLAGELGAPSARPPRTLRPDSR